MLGLARICRSLRRGPRRIRPRLERLEDRTACAVAVAATPGAVPADLIASNLVLVQPAALAAQSTTPNVVTLATAPNGALAGAIPGSLVPGATVAVTGTVRDAIRAATAAFPDFNAAEASLQQDVVPVTTLINPSARGLTTLTGRNDGGGGDNSFSFLAGPARVARPLPVAAPAPAAEVVLVPEVIPVASEASADVAALAP